MNCTTFIDGYAIPSKSATIYEGFAVDVSAGCNGYHGGDGGHGGRVFFEINFPDASIQTEARDRSVFVYGAGDWELSSIIKALHFIIDTLEEQSGGALPEIPFTEELPFD